MSGNNNIADLFGIVDNSQEAPGIFNYRAVAYTFILILLIAAVVSAIARLYVRLFVVRYPGMDDLFLFLSLVTGTALAIVVMMSYSYHMGEHLLTFVLDAKAVEEFTLIGYISNGLYPTATGIVKIAILLQFLRLFEKKSRHRLQTIVMLVITSLWTIAFCFCSWFPAFPIAGMWNRSIPAVRYGLSSNNVDEFTALYISQTATNMVLDLLILCIPIPYFLKSSTSRNSRISLMGLFTMGSVINVISLIRLVTVVDNKVGTYPTLDPSFYTATATVLSSLEVSLAITAASLPVFWPMLKINWSAIFVTTEVHVTEEARTERDRGMAGGGYAMSGWKDTKTSRWEGNVEPWTGGGKVSTVPLVTRAAPLGQNKEAWWEESEEYPESMKRKKSLTDEEEGVVIGPLPKFKRPIFRDADPQRTSLYAETV